MKARFKPHPIPGAQAASGGHFLVLALLVASGAWAWSVFGAWQAGLLCLVAAGLHAKTTERRRRERAWLVSEWLAATNALELSRAEHRRDLEKLDQLVVEREESAVPTLTRRAS